MTSEISIDGRKIGSAYTPYVIAEMSANHNGNIDTAFKIISNNVAKGRMLMICQTGLLSTSEKGFLGSDKWTWNQQPPKMLAGRIENLEVGSTIFACELNPEDTSRIKFLLEGKYIEVINQNANFTLYRVVRLIS